MLAFVRLAGMDTRRAAGGTKVINLASNLGPRWLGWLPDTCWSKSV